MDTIPLGGRIWRRGKNELTRCVSDLLARHLDTPLAPSGGDRKSSPGAGDLLLDFGNDPVDQPMDWCRERGVCYLATDRSTPLNLKKAGPTAILGHGDFGLISHFLRIAVRDVAHKLLHQDAEDPRCPELTKLLHAQNLGRLALLAGVQEAHLVAPSGHLQQDTARSVTELLTVRENDRVVYRPKVRTIRSAELDTSGNLGVLIRGRTFGTWWTGSRLDAEATRDHAGATPTMLQRAAGILAATMWIRENPRCGVLTPAELPHEEILELALPYLGESSSRTVNWRC